MSLLLAVCLVAGAPQMPLSVATADDALAVFGNPAGLAAGRSLDVYALYDFRPGSFGDNFAAAANIGPVAGFWEPGSRFGLGLGIGTDGYMSGVRLVRDSVTRWDIGAMWRPARFISVGAVWRDLNHDWGHVLAGVGVRPVGNRLTLAVDVSSVDPLSPVLGVEAEPLDGISLSGRVKPEDWSFSAGLAVSLGHVGAGAVGSKVGNRYQAGGFVRGGVELRRSLFRKPRRFLELELAGRMEDVEPGFSLMGGGATRTTWGLLELLEELREDRSISGVVLKLNGFGAGFAQLTELREGLARLRDAGKKVFVYAPFLGVGGYYLVSVADKVVCHPLGEVHVPGIALQTMLAKGGLEKLGLEVDYQRHGKYKSAVELFDADSVSESSREQLEAYLDALYGEFVDKASAGRGISRDSFERLVDEGLFLAHEAREAGLVDAVCYADELDSLLEGEVAGFRTVTEKEYTGVEEYEYDWTGPPKVAVLLASGSIASGESGTDFLTGDNTMGAKTLARAIRKARKDRETKAVVLRVDSPGGSGFASDIIWHELEKLKGEKPLVVSMGNMAASGGYYISCGADRVFTSPVTLTGSIGVFGLKLVTEGLYNKLGVRRVTFKRGERADALSDTRGYTPEEDSVLQRQVDWFYEQFVGKVAEGRGMTFDEVDSVAQGRVWAGSDAVKLGLADSLGGLVSAVEWAKTQAGLTECEVELLPEPKSGPLAELGRMLGAKLAQAWRR